jgi:peptidoglycan/LPS O-acetylase OafA/YrhL
MSYKLQESCTGDHLNLARGLAAMAVLVYHVRYRFFLGCNDL